MARIRQRALPFEEVSRFMEGGGVGGGGGEPEKAIGLGWTLAVWRYGCTTLPPLRHLAVSL